MSSLPVPLADMAMLPAVGVDNKDFEDSIQSYFPRIAIVQALSEARKMKIAQDGDFSLTRAGKNITNLGNEIFVTPIDLGWLAVDMGELKFAYDRNCALFKEIEQKSYIRGSKCAWGPRFLVWLKDHGFASLFCNNKTLRNDAAYLKMGMRTENTIHTLKLTTRSIDYKDQQWFGLQVSGLDPLLPLDTSLPTNIGDYQNAIAKFQSEGENGGPEDVNTADTGRG